MILFAKIFKKLCSYFRIIFYKIISNCKIIGKPITISPCLTYGKGCVKFGNKVVLGFSEDFDFWTSYIFFNPREKNSVIEIGDDTHICNHFSAISEGPGIKIGNNVLIGANVNIYDSDFHEINPLRRLNGEPKKEQVIIEDNVWINNNVSILKGSVIGKNSIVACGAVVCGKFPENVIIGGVPAKIIREINE